MGGSVLRARLSCWGRHSLGLATWISCFTPVAGGFFLETWNPVLFKNKQEKSLSLLLAVCLGYWDTIGLSAWKWGLFKHSSKEKCFEPTVELPLGALLKGTYVTVTPGLPQYPTRPDMLKSAEAHRGKSLLSAGSCGVPGHPFWGTSLPHTSLFGLSILQWEGLHSPSRAPLSPETYL